MIIIFSFVFIFKKWLRVTDLYYAKTCFQAQSYVYKDHAFFIIIIINYYLFCLQARFSPKEYWQGKSLM